PSSAQYNSYLLNLSSTSIFSISPSPLIHYLLPTTVVAAAGSPPPPPSLLLGGHRPPFTLSRSVVSGWRRRRRRRLHSPSLRSKGLAGARLRRGRIGGKTRNERENHDS
ncbi:hypothetical protein LINGRAHAP2_LOCUS34821, partial [Linum grandiflorum]